MKKGETKIENIYNFMQQFVDDNGYPPSFREICQKFDIKSTSTVHYYLNKMRERGLIVQESNKKRAFSLYNGRGEANFVPLVGNVSAGQGILAFEDKQGEFPLPQDLFFGKDLFMLHVEGDSMTDAGIDDGDYVIVRSQSNADIGDIVVAFWQEKATIKRLYATSPNLVLHPENATMQNIVIPPQENPTIIGKVVGCLKKF